MRKSLLIILALSLVLSACSNVKPLKAEDFSLFYSDFTSVVSTSELKSRQDRDLPKDEMYKLMGEDYNLFKQELNKVIKQFIETSSQVNETQSTALRKATEILQNLSNEFKSESDDLLKITCNDGVNLEQGYVCAGYVYRWSSAIDRAITCSYYYAAQEFQEIPEFELKKVILLRDYSEKDLSSCDFFKESNSLHGYPRQRVVTEIPDIYAKKFFNRDEYFPVEIADKLYTEFTGDLLTDAIYGSWNGSCAIYRRYERLLSENGFLLGSIKNGTCY